MKGKWAQGIVPRNFRWVMKEQLAVCERPGGYGANHRRVRRQEEIIWIRENGFDHVISLIAAPHNLHNYEELELAYLHRPLPDSALDSAHIHQLYSDIHVRLGDGERLLVHREELGDFMAGLVAGYLLWTKLVLEGPKAIMVGEHLLERQMGPTGREIVTIAMRLPPPADSGV
jgi:hypothetical protein